MPCIYPIFYVIERVEIETFRSDRLCVAEITVTIIVVIIAVCNLGKRELASPKIDAMIC